MASASTTLDLSGSNYAARALAVYASWTRSPVRYTQDSLPAGDQPLPGGMHCLRQAPRKVSAMPFGDRSSKEPRCRRGHPWVGWVIVLPTAVAVNVGSTIREPRDIWTREARGSAHPRPCAASRAGLLEQRRRVGVLGGSRSQLGQQRLPHPRRGPRRPPSRQPEMFQDSPSDRGVLDRGDQLHPR